MGNFWIVPLLFSVSDYDAAYCCQKQYCAHYLLTPFTKCSTVHITCWLRLRNAVLCTLLADSVYEVQYCAHTCWLRLRCAVLCTLIAGSCYEVHYCAHYLLAPVQKCSTVHITCWLLLRSAVLCTLLAGSCYEVQYWTHTHTHTHTHTQSFSPVTKNCSGHVTYRFLLQREKFRCTDLGCKGL